MSLVVLGLGSNLGDSCKIILDAIKALEKVLSELRCASLYETEPMYVKDQDKYINSAIAGYFDRSARELLYQINEIESCFGRDRSRERRWGERSLDIDILLFGEQIIKEADLEIPHPLLIERRFALEPLLELLPTAVEPGTMRPYLNICQALPDQGVKRRYCPKN